MRHWQSSCINNSCKAVIFSGFSMYPSLMPGDTIILRETRITEIITGDILCLPRDIRFVAHRAVHIVKKSQGTSVITKGDNMTIPDPPILISGDKILKVVMIKRKGKGLVFPRYGKIKAGLSRKNLTVGILKAEIGRLIRHVFSFII